MPSSPPCKAYLETIHENENEQWTWDAQGLDSADIFPRFQDCLKIIGGASTVAHPALQLFVVELNDPTNSDRALEELAESRSLLQQEHAPYLIYLEALATLGLPPGRAKDSVLYDKLPPRLSKHTSDFASLPNMDVYRVTAGRFDLVWACGHQSNTVCGIMAHYGSQAGRICANVLDDLHVHPSLARHPMLLGLLAHFHISPEIERWLNNHIHRVMHAVRATGFHYDLAVGDTGPTDEDDLAKRSATVSGVAANIATNHLCWEGLHGLATFILQECDRLEQAQSNIDPTRFQQSNRYIIQHAESCKLRSMAFRDEAESWQKKANIQIQGIFNLIAQRDQNQSIALAKISKDLAEASKKDSTSMKALAVVTMCFLPGTFLASIFAIPFFQWDAPLGNDVVKTRFWVYWAFAIPLTAFTLLLFVVWDRHILRGGSSGVTSTLVEKSFKLYQHISHDRKERRLDFEAKPQAPELPLASTTGRDLRQGSQKARLRISCG